MSSVFCVHTEQTFPFFQTVWKSCSKIKFLLYRLKVDTVIIAVTLERLDIPYRDLDLLYIERKKWKSCFYFLTDGKQHKARELDMITRDLECSWHDNCIICSYDVMGADFENSLCALGQSEKS